jgi:hypothetical protein
MSGMKSNLGAIGSRYLLPALAVIIILALNASCMTIRIGGNTDKPPVIEKFVLTPGSIAEGGASILNWEVTNASSVIIDPGIGNAAGIGSEKVAPLTTTTYKLVASNKAGTKEAALVLNVAAAAVPTVVVAPPPTGPVPSIMAFTATPSSISPGGSATLNWTISNATGARISGVGDVGTSGSRVVYPLTTTSYVIEAFNAVGSSSSSTVVTVVGGPSLYTPVVPSSPPTGSRPGIVAFALTPSSIAAGSSSTLSWDVYNASSVVIDNGIGSVSGSGSRVVSPTSTTTYTLIAQNVYGSAVGTRVLTVTVPPVVGVIPYSWPVINDFHASSSSINAGGEAKIYWNVSNADTITIDHGIGAVSANSFTRVYPAVTTTYTLMASSAGNMVAQAVTISVR